MRYLVRDDISVELELETEILNLVHPIREAEELLGKV
jgi:hypothetical protein